MDLTGRVVEVSRDFTTKKPMIKFLINEEPHGIEDFDGKDLKIKVSKATNPRSLDANAYFHVLCDKLRLELNISMAHCKNMLITSYGQALYVGDQIATAKLNVPFEQIREMEEPHMKFLFQGEDGGYWYRIYRGSHTYNVEEMHKLLEGTIQECLNVGGIEVRTPDEIRRMEQLWNVKLLMKGEKNGKHI